MLSLKSLTAATKVCLVQCDKGSKEPKKENIVLEGLIVLLVVLWLLGFFAFHLAGGLIHILLVVALVVLIFRILGGGRRSTV